MSGSYEEEAAQISGMPLTTQTSRKTIRHDDTMVSNDAGLPEHLRQKLSIDERVAA